MIFVLTISNCIFEKDIEKRKDLHIGKYVE